MYLLTNYLYPISSWRTDERHCFHYFVEAALNTLDYAAQNTESFTVRNRIYRKQKQSLKSVGHASVQMQYHTVSASLHYDVEGKWT